jgi:hypothetical protein
MFGHQRPRTGIPWGTSSQRRTGCSPTGGSDNGGRGVQGSALPPRPPARHNSNIVDPPVALPPMAPPPPEPPPGGNRSAATVTSSNSNNTTPIRIATFNIQSGRGGRLEMALRALGAMNVDVCLLTEAKLTDGVYTRSSNGYSVVSTSAFSHRQGGVALCVRENEYFQVESTACHGPNVISCVLVTGTRRIPLVGVYIPPADISTLEHVNAALSRFGDGPAPILLGDLNVDLDQPEDDRDTQVATVLSDHGLQIDTINVIDALSLFEFFSRISTRLMDRYLGNM